MFDITAFEANRGLQRRSSSLVSLTIDHPPRALSREHGGLMSWPEQFYKPRQPHYHSAEETDEQANNLSIRAMQLSIFGSMINKTRSHSQISPGDQEKPSHSLSYPRVPSAKGRPLVSTKSEGSSTLGKNIEARKHKGQCRKTAVESLSTRTSRVLDYSSDESGAEDEHVVRIDSPSRLSFRQAT